MLGPRVSFLAELLREQCKSSKVQGRNKLSKAKRYPVRTNSKGHEPPVGALDDKNSKLTASQTKKIISAALGRGP